MVRKVGNLSPINAPSLYDISGENMQKVGQDVQQASQASMQALSALGNAYGANTQRLYNDQATLEKARMMQAQADEQNSQNDGGILGGLGQAFNTFIGGLTAAEDIKMKKEALAQEMLLKQTEATRKANLEERNMSLDETKFEYTRQAEENKATLENLGGYVKQALAESYANLETVMSTLTQEQGVTYADKMFEQQASQFNTLFEAYPTLKTAYYTGAAEIRQKIQDKYSKAYSDTIKEDRALVLNTQESKMQLAIATRKEEIGYAAGSWTEQQATEELNATISLGMNVAMQDPQFQQAVKQDPALMGKMYGKVLSALIPSWTEYAKKNAEINSAVIKIQKANIMFASNPDLTDPATISNISEDLQRLGLPEYAKDPNSYPSSQISRAKTTKAMFDAQEGLRVAASQNDPMFSLDTPEHLFVANSFKATELYSALNQKDGLTFETILNRSKKNAKEAGSRKDFRSEAYWNSFTDFYKSYDTDKTVYNSLQEKYRKLTSEYAEMVKPQSDTVVIPDGLSATRVPVGGIKQPPKFTQEQVDQTKSLMLDVQTQILQVENKWAVNGINLKDLSDPTFLNNVKQQAAPYKAQLDKKLLSSGQVPNTGNEAMQTILSPQQPSQRVASGAKPLNFTGGKTQTSLVVQAKGNALPFADNVAPLTPSVPVNGTLASLKGVGIVPFKGGNVSIVDDGTKGLTLKSTDPRVATMVGGKVVYSGGTQTMGNVVVVQTSDGVAEVYSNIKGANVKAGDYVPIGTTLGTSDKLDFQVWQTTDALAALRKEGLRNELNPLKYLNGMVVSVKTPDGLGTLDITKNKPTVIAGGNSNMFASSDYSVYGDMVFDKRTNSIRKLTKKESSYLYPNGMKTERAKANERYQTNETVSRNSSPSNIQYFGGATSMRTLGNVFQQAGIRVRDYAPFDKVDDIHAPNSDHYNGLAMDLQGTPEKLRQAADDLVASADGTGVKQVIYKGQIWNDDGKGWKKFTPKKGARGDVMHNGHVHVSFRGEEFKPRFNGVYYPTPKVTDTFNTGDSKRTSNLRAFADVISYAEGTSRYGYSTYFGGGQFDNSKPHPEKVLGGSSAAGRYQFMPATWRSVHGGQNPPMTVAEQDAAFISLLKGRGVYEDVLNGNFEKAFKGVANEWASVKGNSYMFKGKPQGVYEPRTLAERARAKSNEYNSKVARQSNPVASVITDRPQRLTKASVSPSAYGKPNVNYNFGYTKLIEDSEMRQAIYRASVSTGVPQQFLADIFGTFSEGFTNHKLSINDVKMYSSRIKGQKNLSVTNAALKMGLPMNVEDIGKHAARSYTSNRKEYHSSPVSSCTVCQQVLRSGAFFVPHFK